MLTAWAVYTGDKYGPRYLWALRDAYLRHLGPHRFRVISDRAIPGVDVVPADPELPGWWQKVRLFAPGIAEPGGVNLYVDLDSVVVDDLEPMVEQHAEDLLAMPRNWARSGHGGCQSSVMIWRGGAFPELAADLTVEHRQRLWGDQEWITERIGPARVAAIAHPQVVSYKYHCRGLAGPPAGARVVTFHGKPDPHECLGEAAWIAMHW